MLQYNIISKIIHDSLPLNVTATVSGVNHCCKNARPDYACRVDPIVPVTYPIWNGSGLVGFQNIIRLS